MKVVDAYRMERRPRDCKKLKLAESGKPDLNIPLSTIAKFSGGTNSSSSPSLSSPMAGRLLSAGETSIRLPLSPPPKSLLLPTLIFRFRAKKREKIGSFLYNYKNESAKRGFLKKEGSQKDRSASPHQWDSSD
jgi:hypothetical protein